MDLPIRAWAHHIADRRLQRVTDCSVPVNSKGKRRAARADPGTRRSIAAGPLPFVASSTVTATPCNTGDKDFATPGSAQPRPVGYQDRTRKRALRPRLSAPGRFGPLLRAEAAAHARLDAHRPAHIGAAVSGTATLRKTWSEPCRGWHILFRRPTGTPTWRWPRRFGGPSIFLPPTRGVETNADKQGCIPTLCATATGESETSIHQEPWRTRWRRYEASTPFRGALMEPRLSHRSCSSD